MILTNVGSHGIILIRADRFREFCHAIQEEAVITELSSQEKVIGVKQSRKAIREGRAKQVYLACDADDGVPGNAGPDRRGSFRSGSPSSQ